MAAGQRKKKLNGANATRFSSYEHNTGSKKMKWEPSDIILNMTSHVSLEWDDSQKKVVAKRGQIGITWKDMAPFVDCASEFQTGLADVLSIPQEIFGVDNIADVLSYEVWKTSLSEQERNLLIQFLPKGVDVDDIVRSLLAGENFHFGNPFCKWVASLYAGDLHPDTLLHVKQHLGVTRHSYFCELTNYHSRIIESLSKLKEKYTDCRKTDKEITTQIWRKEGTKKLTNRKLSISPGKHNTCIQDTDATNYMSYIKINKKQHLLVKNIDNVGDGIHSKFLNNVLGDINSFKIQSYKSFEEEEKKTLHQYWLQLANTDLPTAFKDHRQCRLSREEWRKCVHQELEENKMMVKAKMRSSGCFPREKVDDGEMEQESTHDMVEDIGRFQSIHYNDQYHNERKPSLGTHPDNPKASDQNQNMYIFKATTHVDNTTINHSIDSHGVKKILSLDSPHKDSPFDMNLQKNEYLANQVAISLGPSRVSELEAVAEDMMETKAPFRSTYHLERNHSFNIVHKDILEQDQNLLKCSYNSPGIPQFLQSTTADLLEEKLIMSSPKDRRQGGSMHHNCRRYSPEHQTPRSVGVLAVQQPQSVSGRSPQLVDLDVQILEQETAESVSSPSHDGFRETMFSSNVKQDLSLFLPSFHMEGMPVPCLEEQLRGSKQQSLQFMVTNDGLRHPSTFPHLFHDHQQFPKQSQAREKELCMLPLLNRNGQSSNRNPSQGHFLSVGLQDLAIFQTPVNNGMMEHDWFASDHDTCHSGHADASFGSGCAQVEDARITDGSLFSVLSECSKLASHSSFSTTTGPEGILQGREFVGTSIPCSEGIYPYSFGDTNSRDAAALRMKSMPWMNFSLQQRRL